MNKLDDKIAIVTGGGKGIGRAISLRFASEGAKVAIWEKDLDAAEETSKQISESGGMAIRIECEISDKNSVSNALKETIDALGKPTHLINNAGIAHVGTATTTTEEDFDRVMSVNTKGLFLCLQAVLPVLVDNGGGVILNLASIASRLGIADRFAYSASKGAALAMTLSVAKDYVDQGIRCNCLCPGRVHTPFVDGFLEKYYPDKTERSEKFTELSKYQPIGRMGEPEEIASLATFLCSEEASFITGSAYDVDGGTMTLR
jgi:NAD(P)-dependent dehydrogenase (short-subunit alcohol dehydrogenase family)